jgi:hypothetical protein
MSCIANLGSSSYSALRKQHTHHPVKTTKTTPQPTTMYNKVNTSNYQNGQNLMIVGNPYAPNHHSAPAKHQGGFASANTIQTAVNGRPSNHLGLGTTPRMNNVNDGTNPSPNSEMSAAKPNLLFEGGGML